MSRIKRFEDLEAWRAARQLVARIYRVSGIGKFSRDYQLRHQITGAAVSVMSNIAEGFDRGTDREFIRFLRIAKASASEVQSQLYVALDQQYVDQECFDDCAGSVTRTSTIVGGLIRYLANSARKRTRSAP